MIRNRQYLDHLRSEPCLICGRRSGPDMTVEPAHIGTAGKSLKSSDDEAIPLCHDHHAECHQRGEITVMRERLSNQVLRDALRVYAREMYRLYSPEAYRDHYPCCGGDLVINIPRPSQYMRENCPHCSATIWHWLSPINPQSWTESGFLIDHLVDEDRSIVYMREP